jgi:hypothetical protein
MTMEDQPALTAAKSSKFRGWWMGGALLAAFAAGSLLTVLLVRASQARASRDRVFRLLV